jgi:hypothetical protein
MNVYCGQRALVTRCRSMWRREKVSNDCAMVLALLAL